MIDESEIKDINAKFASGGWQRVKELAVFDTDYIPEDLSQYQRQEIVVDFGFYGDGTDITSGYFAIYIVVSNDWERPAANLRFANLDLALEMLKLLSDFTRLHPLLPDTPSS